MKRYICLLCSVLFLAGCNGGAAQVGMAYTAREDINLGEDMGSRAAAVVIHVMQTTDKYAPRLRQLVNAPDTLDAQKAAADLRDENLLYNIFITDFAAAMYNARPITGSGYTAKFEQNEMEISFAITTTDDVSYEGKLDENAAACYVIRQDGDDMQLCKFIADTNGYYIELVSQDPTGEWVLHRAYYSGNKWLSARTRLDEQPEPDTVYHYLPYDFEHYTKSMAPMICRSEYYYKEQLTYWNFAQGVELNWQLDAQQTVNISGRQ